MHSVTSLSAYLYCKRKLWLEKVLGLREIPKAALIKGSVRHKIYELCHKEEQGIVVSIQQPDYQSILHSYTSSYKPIMLKVLSNNESRLHSFAVDIPDFQSRIWHLLEEEAAFRADIVHKFIVSHKVFGNDLWDALTPKIESELKIRSPSLKLSGIVDKILVYETGRVPVELKTGKMPREGVWPGHKIQIGAYALLLEEKFREEIKEGYVHYLDGNEQRHISINPFLREEIKDLVGQVESLLCCRQVPSRVTNMNKCNACGLREKCYDDKFITTKVKALKQTTLE